MKFIKSTLLQKVNGRKKGKYLLTIELTDYDIEMIEDLATSYCTKEEKPGCEFKEKYHIWLRNIFADVFHRLWREHDEV